MRRKLVKRLEDLLVDSNALRPHVLPTIKALTESVSKPVDFAIQLAQKVNGHLSELRSTKAPLKLTSVLAFVRELAGQISAIDGGSSWNVLDDIMKQLLPFGGEHHMKCLHSWLKYFTRICI